MSRPYQNRVRPDGRLEAVPARGTMMGNRGGKIHESGRIKRKWASKQWICCVLEFKNRQREVMGEGYTELFFLDEATALAAGHRPCFECRRADAMRFAELWAEVKGLPSRARAPEMDKLLHAQRLHGPQPARDLPDGAMFQLGSQTYVKSKDGARLWSCDGYGPRQDNPTNHAEALTPPIILDILRAGYTPQFHPTYHM